MAQETVYLLAEYHGTMQTSEASRPLDSRFFRLFLTDGVERAPKHRIQVREQRQQLAKKCDGTCR